MTRSVLDTTVSAETPEGILLELRPAGLCARAGAFLLDSLIRFAIFYAITIVTAVMGRLGLALLLVLLFGLEWLYPVAFELSPWGATPGKRALGLKVVMDNGLPITPAASITRNLLRTVDFMPFLYGAGVVCLLLRPDSKRLGDLAAASLVVHQPRKARRLVLPDVPPIAPVLALAPADQAAVISLAARAPRLTGERLDELASLAAAVSGDAGRSGPEVTARVLGVAQWFLGKRSS